MHVFHMLTHALAWQGPKSGGTHDIANIYHALILLHGLIPEHVRTITFFRHP